MTREYNKPRRNDSRPPFRQQSSSNRYGEEQSSRPGRPRLNREIVDRAWEQGAQTQHADYRPRTNGQGRQNNWRNNQPEYSSYQNGTGGNRPYGNRQPSNGTGGNRPYGNRQPSNGAGGNRPPYGNRQSTYDTGNRPFGNRQPAYDNPGNRPNNYRHSGPPPQGHRGTSQSPYEQDRYQGRGPNNRTNGDRPYQRRDDQRGPSNDRRGYRSGPPRFYEENGSRESTRNTRRPPHEEHFEGDYEHFDYNHARGNTFRSPEKPHHDQRYNRDEPPVREKHITRLPDGRVLKGPRPAQRKNAQFWTEIASDTEGLMQHIPEPPVQEQAQEHASADGTKGKKAREKKPRTAQSKETARSKKSASEGQGLKPSQRGFKWPAP